jgi:hypothetical protein
MSMGGHEKMGWVRAGVGMALLLAPGTPMRISGREVPTGSSVLLMRTIGIRDLVIGLGMVSAARSEDPEDVRRWTTAGFTSDSLDTVASLASFRMIGARDALGATLLAFAFAFAGARLLGTVPEVAAGRGR